MYNQLIAPENLIVEDYNTFKPNISLVGNGENIEDYINFLSVFGHSQKGHRVFSGRPYPDTTIIDIINAVNKSKNLDPETETEKIRRAVSYHIDSAKFVLEELIKIVLNEIPKEISLLYDTYNGNLVLRHPRTSDPIYGLANFDKRNYTIKNPLMFLRGAYIASQMDSIDMREEKQVKNFLKHFQGEKINIGGGKCHVSNLSLIRRRRIPQEKFFGKANSPEDIDYFYSQGILIKRDELKTHKADVYNQSLVNTYVREEDGLGCCDDATILGIGFLHMQEGNLDDALDAFYGAAFIDTIDTIDKVTAIPITGGADEYLGEYINSRFRDYTSELDYERMLKDSPYKLSLIKKHNQRLREQFGDNLSRIPEERLLKKILKLKDSRGKYNLVDDKTVFKAIYFGAKNNSPNIKFSDSVRRFNEFQRPNGRTLTTPIEAHIDFLLNNQVTENMVFGFERADSSEFYQAIDSRLDGMQSSGLLYIPNNIR